MTSVRRIVLPPGSLIAEELEARGWSQQTFAEITGTSPTLISEVVNAKRSITPETAALVARAFGTSTEVWLGLEARYQASLVKPRKADDAERRAKIYAKAPVKEMVKRGWIVGAKNAASLEQQVLAFFEVKSLDDDVAFDYAARKRGDYSSTTPAQWAWLHRARQMARVLKVRGPWKANRLRDLVRELRALALGSPATQDVPRVLSDFGIRFLVVAPLPQAKMQGATFWLGDHQPVIALTMLFDRIDNFWHTLMHEVGHIAHGDRLSIDVEVLSSGDKPESERLADEFAVDTLIPQAELEDFCVRVGPLYSEVKILGFANRIRVHPGIVVGQLHHRGSERRGLEWTHFRKLLLPVRKFVTLTAFTDGWGTVAPL